MPPNPYRRQPNINDMMYPKGSKQPRQVWAAVLNVYKEPPSTTPPVTPSPTPTPTSTPASYPVTFVSSGYTIEDLCYNPQSIPTLYSPQPFFTNQQQLYYDSALTQYIDWSDDDNAFFASTGGTQYYFYGFATFGLGTYGFGCPTQTPTPTVTQTQTPTNTPTPSVSPTNTLTPTPSISPTSTQTPTPTNTTTPSITPTNTNTPSITPSSAFCSEQFSITSDTITGLNPVGTYDRLYSYTGGSFNYGYFNGIGPYNFVPGTAPDGNNYAVFGGNNIPSSGSVSCMVRTFVSGVDVSWSIVQSVSDYVFNGGNVGQTQEYITGQTTSLGVVYPAQARSYVSGSTKEYIYLAYSSVCPSPTPSITPTNTQTPSVSPTSTLTPTPSVSPTNTSTPTPTNTQTPTPTTPKVILSGGTVTDAGGFRTHTFTSNGTLTVIQGGPVQLLMVAGGGGGGGARSSTGGGGGGGGGQIYTAYTISTGGSIVIGQGGAGGPNSGLGVNGDNTTGLGFTAIGGGGGGCFNGSVFVSGLNGGNGGGATCGSNLIGSGTTGQGNNGGLPYTDGGGNARGGRGGSSNNQAGYSIGGDGGGCAGGGVSGASGAANTGNGGGAATGSLAVGGNGGSGIVKITYAL